MSNVTATAGGSRLWKGYALPALAATVPLSVAIIGAFFSDSGGGNVVGGVEGLAGRSARLLENVGLLLPIGLAFAAGMVSTVNPCGFPMLPAYLAMYVGSDEGADVQPAGIHQLSRALTVAGVVTLGFLLLFGSVGLVLAVGAGAIRDVMPFVGLGIGVVLALVGAWLLGGGKLYSGFAQRAADRMGDPTTVSIRGYFLFGLAYATASLSCTLPIFMAVTGISLASGGTFDAIGRFLAYGLGMGLVILVLTLALALFKGALVGSLRKIIPYVQPASAAFMILAGAYIVFYWLTIGGVLDQFRATGA